MIQEVHKHGAGVVVGGGALTLMCPSFVTLLSQKVNVNGPVF